jgi:SAM-dependent methyltransferase
VVSTDYQPAILSAAPTPGVTYQVCDAERADEAFAPGSFDLVFSSNLLEHVPDPRRALQASLRLLAPGGVAVHVVPGVNWKLAQLALHYPNLAAVTLQRLTQGSPAPDPLGERPNNAKRPELISRWTLLWPQPHGISRTNLGELFAFRRRRWLHEVEGAGLELVAALPGPVFSGFGFGLDGLRELLERAGVSAETAFVAVRPGETGPARGWF